MPKSVEIEVADDGSITVGLEPPDGDEGAGEGMPTGPGDPAGPDDKSSYMKPVASIDEALQVAKDLLTNPQAQAAQQDPNQMWNQVKRDKQLQEQPGGPLMGKA